MLPAIRAGVIPDRELPNLSLCASSPSHSPSASFLVSKKGCLCLPVSDNSSGPLTHNTAKNANSLLPWANAQFASRES